MNLLRTRQALYNAVSFRSRLSASLQSPGRLAYLGGHSRSLLPLPLKPLLRRTQLPPQPLTTVCRVSTKQQRRSRMGRKEQQQQQEQEQPGSGSPREEVQLPRKQLLPISLEGGVLAVRDGRPILDNVTPLASVSRSGEVTVLGLAAQGGPASMEDFPLGQLRCRRWLCCARNKLFWMTPEWGTTARELPPETQFLLLELGDDLYAILLPLIDNQTFRGTLRPPRKGTPDYESGTLFLRLESGSSTVMAAGWQDALLVAAGTDPFVLVEEAVVAAAALSGGARPLRDKRVPPTLDAFGFCTWDAFYSSVSASGVNQGVSSLRAGNTPAKWVVIDDGWQCTDLDEPFRQPPQVPTLKSGEMLDSDVLESYMEGEIEMIGIAAKDIPAGTATGSIMQEVVGATQSLDTFADYHSLAQQRAAAAAAGQQPSDLVAQHRKRPSLLVRVSTGILEYLTGLAVGFFQAMVLIVYQWVVDPASADSWPVRFFTYLTNGPLKQQMLQFYAVSTAFTRRLTDVRANSKFSSPDATADDITSAKPENLKWVVSHLKKEHGVQYVYCWHGLPAYWAGVAPDARAVSKYGAEVHYGRATPGLLEIEPSIAWNPATLGGIGVVINPEILFDDMHTYLELAGVTGVKVDCQAGVGLVAERVGGGPASALRYHSALEDSVAAHFPDNDCINCMCHSTENIYRWRDTAVARASDDFYPTDKASHKPHVVACSFNSLFLSALAQPDWDMFHSRHDTAELHATARAVSGGPVYVSDSPGHHDYNLLQRLVLPDGSVLRARLPGRPTRDSLFADVARDGRSLLKVFNLNGCNGIVAVMNLQGASWDRARRRFYTHNASPPTLTTTVRVSDVEPFRAFLEAAGCSLDGNGATAGALPAVHAGHAAGGDCHAAGHGHVSDADSGSSNSGVHAAVAQHVADAQRIGGGAAAAAAVAMPGNGTAAAAAGQHPAGVPDWVMYVSATGKLHRVQWSEGVEVTLQGGESSMVTVAPILSTPSGLEFSPLGFSNMLNGGGGVLSVRCPGSSTAGVAAVPEAARQALAAAVPGAAGHLLAVDSSGSISSAGGNGGSSAGAAAPVATLVAGGEAIGEADSVTVQLRGCGSFLAYSSRAPEQCWLLGVGEGQAERSPVEFVYHAQQLVVEVPWAEESDGLQELVVCYGAAGAASG